MKESMAGTWIFGIVALFIVLFSSFIAYSISYTKAFKVKNEILNYIEQAEGFTMAKDVDNKDVKDLSNQELSSSKAVDAKAFLLLRNVGYNTASVNCSEGIEQYGGYCVEIVCSNVGNKTSSNSRVVYKVTTFIKASIPVVNINLKLPISGETKALYYQSEYARMECPVSIENAVTE